MEGQQLPPGPDDVGEPVQISPTRSGVRIRLPVGGDLRTALDGVERALKTGQGVRGAAVTVDAAGRALSVSELREIETLLLERQGAQLLQVVEGQREPASGSGGRSGRRRRVKAAEPAAAEAAAATEPRTVPSTGRTLAAEPEAPVTPHAVPVLTRVASSSSVPTPPTGLPVDMTPTLLVRRTLRSGQRVRFNGNVVVLGDVNPGAEIVASGDIVVMGTLRGVAHAGATGSPDAVVVAFRLQPVQLRVGSVIGRAPDGQVARPDAPEVARLRDDALVIERFLAQGPE